MEGSTLLRLIVLVMVGVILATITLAAVSYGAFRLRERRRPRNQPLLDMSGPLFFERVEVVPTRPAAPAE